jgi:hypothetical protein
MRRAIPIISVLFLLACSQPEAQQTTLPLLPVTPVVVIPTTVALQATTTTSTTTTTEVPLVSDVNDYIDEARALYGRCGEWYETALAAGWELPTYWPDLSRIMYRESRCTPDACSKSTSGLPCRDAGLTQINQVHRAGMASLGYTWPDDAFIPEINLRYAWVLYRDACINNNGQRPWSYIEC